MALFIGAKVFYVAKNRYDHFSHVLFPFFLALPLSFRVDRYQASRRLIPRSSRSQKWDKMTAWEKQSYLETTTDKGNKRYVVFGC